MRHLWSLALAVLAGCGIPHGSPVIDIATTTSVQNSGLLSVLLPAYDAAVIRVHAAGSGRALQMLSDGTVSAVISHAPDAEQRYLTKHPSWRYRKLAYNRFIVVGPATDPAGIKTAPDVLSAFSRIAQRSIFVSRGDQSGTHERELALWQAAGITPPAERLLISGRSMALALRHADEKQAYTLTDEGTFWQLAPQLSMVELYSDDPRLLNTYAVIDGRAGAVTAAFFDWMTSDLAKAIVADFRIADRAPFRVWPQSCPDDSPRLQPCGWQ